MQLNNKFIKEVMRLFKNVLVSEAEAQRIVEVLESREEFLAWLLLRQDIMKLLPEVSPARSREPTPRDRDWDGIRSSLSHSTVRVDEAITVGRGYSPPVASV